MFRFERLKVWHKAVELFDVVDKVSEGFPARVQFSVADQLRRAALSVPSNIAEGCGRETARDSRHFYSVAKGSVFEVVSIATVCERRGLMTVEEYRDIYGGSAPICVEKRISRRCCLENDLPSCLTINDLRTSPT